MTMIVVIIAVATGLASALGTGLVKTHAERKGVVDLPNHRSSHSDPTPRGGGLALVFAWLSGTLICASWFAVDSALLATFIVGGALVTLLGWVDDHRGLGVAIRLVVQLVVAVAVIAVVGAPSTLDLGHVSLALGPCASIVAVIGVVWLMNLYNFMDGIDGLASVQAILAGLAISVLFFRAGHSWLAMTSLLLAAAAAGFLFWNWPPARIFLGDVGSLFLGYVFATFFLVADRHGVPSSLILLPLAGFIADATITVILRLVRGEAVFAAHRSHTYQVLTQRGWSHRRVTMHFIPIGIILGGLAAMGQRGGLWLSGALVVGTSLVLLAGGVARRESAKGSRSATKLGVTGPRG